MIEVIQRDFLRDVIRLDIMSNGEKLSWGTLFLDEEDLLKGYIHLYCSDRWLPPLVEWCANHYPDLSIKWTSNNK